MSKHASGRPTGQTARVDDAGVIQLVGQNDVPVLDEDRQQTLIGIPATDIGKSGLRSEKICDLLLEDAMTFEAATDEPDACRARPVAIQSVDAGLHHIGMVGESEIVVRAEDQDFAEFIDPNDGVHRCRQVSELLVCSCVAKVSEGSGQPGRKV